MTYSLPRQNALVFVLLVSPLVCLADPGIAKKDLIETNACRDVVRKEVKAKDVFKNTPFKAGEKSTFEVNYSNIYVGDADLVVNQPYKFNDSWHFMFDLYGRTGEWYSSIFRADDRARAISRAGDFGAAWFFLDQDEKRVFKEAKLKEKYLNFSAEKCLVTLKTVTTKKGKKIEKSEPSNHYHPLAMDAVTAAFKLRTHTFKIGKVVREPVYTSRKNWWLEATPEAYEDISTSAGKFKTVRIKLKTYAGEDLQQKGDVFMWIATKHPARPIVKLVGDVKIGRISARLKEFKPGS